MSGIVSHVVQAALPLCAMHIPRATASERIIIRAAPNIKTLLIVDASSLIFRGGIGGGPLNGWILLSFDLYSH